MACTNSCSKVVPSCHYGPAMSDSAFHAIRMPASGRDATLDLGRSAVLATLVASPRSAGRGGFSDDIRARPIRSRAASAHSTRRRSVRSAHAHARALALSRCLTDMPARSRRCTTVVLHYARVTLHPRRRRSTRRRRARYAHRRLRRDTDAHRSAHGVPAHALTLTPLPAKGPGRDPSNAARARAYADATAMTTGVRGASESRSPLEARGSTRSTTP